MQMLTGEESEIRLVLVQQLAGLPHFEASAGLARLALFDLSSDVRAAAVEGLSRRPRAEYRAVLLDGFRYPWAPVADHAAEALVALEDHDAVPALKELAREADPTIDSTKAPAVREVVRINHLRNCLMCHAASHNRDDQVRGLIPTPGSRLPPLIGYYGQQQDGNFVRADITYLRQDFSVK
jgi:HEAT repeat protein